jgi:phage major head subunit gpT-like protein
MGVVTSDFLAGLMTNFQALAMMSLAEQEKDAVQPKIATLMPSESDRESYGWLGEVPAMREWKAERAVYGLTGFDYTITNRHFEGTIAVDRDTLADGKYGLIKPKIQELGQRAALYPDELLLTLLAPGTVEKAFDGTAFFANTRVIGESANIDNLLAGTGIDTTAKILTDLAAAIVALGTFQDARGKPMNLIQGAAPVTIVCPLAALIAIRSALLPAVAGVNRAEAGFVAEVIGSAWLDAVDANDWYVLVTNRVLKPLIYQLRQKPEFVALDQPTAHAGFMSRMLYYGIDMRCNAGFGDPRYAVKVVNAA